MTTLYKLSPSDLTFLWDDCKRCFYLKVKQKFDRPRQPFPAIFSRIDSLMKKFFQGRSTTEISDGLPDGIVKFGERWVQSQPILLPGHTAQCYLLGKFDTVVEFSDGSFGVIDFKTSAASPGHVPFYSRQLHAYAYALENPAPGKFTLKPISKLGLLVVEPVDMGRYPDGRIAYMGDVTWQEIPLDINVFLAFIGEVLAVLELAEPPEAAEKCTFCQYRESARQNDI